MIEADWKLFHLQASQMYMAIDLILEVGQLQRVSGIPEGIYRRRLKETYFHPKYLLHSHEFWSFLSLQLHGQVDWGVESIGMEIEGQHNSGGPPQTFLLLLRNLSPFKRGVRSQVEIFCCQ